MKNCQNCKKPISPKAKTCPNCGHPLKKKTSGCAWLFLIASMGIIIFGYALFPDELISPTSPEKQLRQQKTNTVLSLYPHVRDHLKSPGNAKFAVSTDAYHKQEGELHYIQSYVDSQNSFGATIRNYFSAVIEENSGGRTIRAFTIGPEPIHPHTLDINEPTPPPARSKVY